MGGLAMNKHVVNHFNQWLSDKPVGFEFTAYDFIERMRHISPWNTPTTATVGHLVKMSVKCQLSYKTNGVAVYEVVA